MAPENGDEALLRIDKAKDRQQGSGAARHDPKRSPAFADIARGGLRDRCWLVKLFAQLGLLPSFSVVTIPSPFVR
jgi:hypothetical protein